MILNNTQENPAVLSNVGQIGEFRIRNSAKAFGILSSGLYANKIRAIVRELSCNAVDSHVAAGRADEPFEVHLPTSLEPWFSVRDFGVGLSHEQVVNIYTTYFESTKTASNEFIGALGLGSKSPFSYTENFSVTAVQNGTKGIYTAFINEQGVPSIALMTTESTDEANGVEVKFAVPNSNDFGKFRQEAQEVYRWFSLRPQVTGVYQFEIPDLQYSIRDIVPGVHGLEISRYRSHSTQSYAVMGNIAYPIEVPNTDSVLGSLGSLLNCGLVMHFDIGELEFQASREGLSYIPQTIQAIKSKLEQVSSVLCDRLTEEINQLPNMWDRYSLILKRYNENLWHKPTLEYVAANPNPWIENDKRGSLMSVCIQLKPVDLAAQFNIKLTVLYKTSYRTSYSVIQPERVWNSTTQQYGDFYWNFGPGQERFALVFNDTKSGGLERAKNHFRDKGFNGNLWYFTAEDKNQPMDVEGFLKLIHNPPDKWLMYVSNTEKIERKKTLASGISLLRLDSVRKYGRTDYSWSELSGIEDLDKNTIHFYVPLSGFELITNFGITSTKELVTLYEQATNSTVQVYGIRKKDLEQVQSLPNWVNFEHHVINYLNSFTDKDFNQIALSLVPKSSTLTEYFRLLQSRNAPVNQNGLFWTTLSKYAKLTPKTISFDALQRLCRNYKTEITVKNLIDFDIQKLTNILAKDFQEVALRYPLLDYINQYSAPALAVAEYINFIDQTR